MNSDFKYVIIIVTFIIIVLSPIILMNIFENIPSYFIALELVVAPAAFVVFVFLSEKIL